MNNTEIFGSANTSLVIGPSPLMSIIAGGFQRFIGRNMTSIIIVDGSLSYDPDFPESREFWWVWLVTNWVKTWQMFSFFFFSIQNQESLQFRSF